MGGAAARRQEEHALVNARPGSQTRPRVLVLDEELPWPLHTGKRLRTTNLLTALARDFAIDYVTHANGATPEAIAEMSRRGIAVHVSPSFIPEKRGPVLPFRVLASIVRGLPYSVHSHCRAPFRRTVQRLLREHRYSLVHYEWAPYAEYARDIDLPTCIAAHNVEWLTWQRLAGAENRTSHRLLFDLQAKLMRRFETRVFTQFEHATAVSEPDAEIIRGLGCRNVVVVPNGVDADAYRPPAPGATEPRTLVFTGSLDWRPNLHAIRWFIDEVHPILSKLTPYRFYVVGRTPPPWLTDRSRVPEEIVVTGMVEDVRPWIGRASVFAVPLQSGGGTRLKILEALAMARPVVSTRVGAEGLAVTEGTHLLLADQPHEFADAIHRLFEDGERRAALGRAGRLRIDELYRWESIAPIQGELWRRIIHAPAPSTRSSRA